MTFRCQYTIPADISLLTINPHMHLLGKSFLAYAVDPAGDTIPLVRIPRWDFRWQYFYTFEHLLPMPRGTTIYVEGEMDNTAGQPLQSVRSAARGTRAGRRQHAHRGRDAPVHRHLGAVEAGR